MAGDGRKVVAQNRKARYDYAILETYECGIVLKGAEVKSIRDGKIQLKDSYARVENGEAWLFGVHVAPYAFAQGFDVPDPERPRKLLLKHREIDEVGQRTTREALTLIPLSVYFKGGKAKVEIGLARGKKQYDKRHSVAERDAKREAERAFARSRRGE